MKSNREFVLIVLVLGVLCLGSSVGCSKADLPVRLLVSNVTLKADTENLPADDEWDSEKQEATVQFLRARLHAMEIDGKVDPLGEDEIRVQLPKVDDRDELINALIRPGVLEFRHFHHVHFHSATQYRPAAAKYSMDFLRGDEHGRPTYLFFDREGNEIDKSVVIEESKLILTGDDLRPVSNAEKDPMTFRSVVALEFSPEGRRKFADFTRRNVDELLAILLDGEILSAPSIRQPILDGRAIIESNFSSSEAKQLAGLLNSGVLPVPLTLVSVEDTRLIEFK